MKSVFLTLSMVLSALVPLLAQDKGSAGSRPPGGRVAHFIYTSMPEGIENPVSVMTGTDLVQLVLSKRAASESVRIPADGILRVVRKVENPQDPAKPTWLTLAQAVIPETVNQALVILIPLDKARDGRVFHAKVQDLADFTGGDYLYLNLTNTNVGVEMGQAKLALKPGETKIHDARDLTASTNVPIRYSFYHPTEKQWKMLSSSTVVLHQTRREICIFSWDPRFNRIDYHGITFPVARDDKH
jgi:hypothetical protein